MTLSKLIVYPKSTNNYDAENNKQIVIKSRTISYLNILSLNGKFSLPIGSTLVCIY